MLKGLISHPNCTMTRVLLFLITRKAIRYFKSWKTRDSFEEAGESGKKKNEQGVWDWWRPWRRGCLLSLSWWVILKRVHLSRFQVDLHISVSGHNAHGLPGSPPPSLNASRHLSCLFYKRFLFWILSLHEYSCLCLLRDVSRGRWSIWVAWRVHEEDRALFTDGGTAAGLRSMG